MRHVASGATTGQELSLPCCVALASVVQKQALAEPTLATRKHVYETCDFITADGKCTTVCFFSTDKVDAIDEGLCPQFNSLAAAQANAGPPIDSYHCTVEFQSSKPLAHR